MYVSNLTVQDFPSGFYRNLAVSIGAAFSITVKEGKRGGESISSFLEITETAWQQNRLKFISIDGIPVSFLIWAELSEKVHLKQNPLHARLHASEWNEGPYLWLARFSSVHQYERTLFHREVSWLLEHGRPLFTFFQNKKIRLPSPSYQVKRIESGQILPDIHSETFSHLEGIGYLLLICGLDAKLNRRPVEHYKELVQTTLLPNVRSKIYFDKKGSAVGFLVYKENFDSHLLQIEILECAAPLGHLKHILEMVFRAFNLTQSSFDYLHKLA
jgi:hemolysin-activating ACP:hemolysin acyltransferase